MVPSATVSWLGLRALQHDDWLAAVEPALQASRVRLHQLPLRLKHHCEANVNNTRTSILQPCTAGSESTLMKPVYKRVLPSATYAPVHESGERWREGSKDDEERVPRTKAQALNVNSALAWPVKAKRNTSHRSPWQHCEAILPAPIFRSMFTRTTW